MNISAVGEAMKTPDLRKKILFTLGLVALYRLGSVLPTPGVNYGAINRCVDLVQDNSFYAVVNLFSGGALLHLSIFALGVMPYITATIIFQLLAVVIPKLEVLKKDGKAGQAKITQYTRYLTIGLAVLQSTAILSLARTPGALFSGCPEKIIANDTWLNLSVMIIVMTAGTAMIMWFAELITERGVGNGMSLLIFISIIAGIPAAFAGVLATHGVFALVMVLLVTLALIVGVVFMEQGQRRIPVQYAKRQVGSRVMGGASTYLPLKVNMAGVIPVIFASSLLFVPVLIVQLTGSTDEWAQWIQRELTSGSGLFYTAAFALMIIFFAYFYVSITFNPTDVAEDMKKYGGFIPGIRAGKPTADYLDYVLTRLTAPGSLYLAFIAILPLVAFSLLGVSSKFVFGGTSLLIVVGVGLDTVKQIQSQLQQRNYEGFLR